MFLYHVNVNNYIKDRKKSIGVGYVIISKGICSQQIMARWVLLAINDNACLILYKLCHVVISAAV